MGVTAAELALGKALGHTPTIQWPIKLTATMPFHIGVAALVFVSTHILDPADDVAQFGIYPLPQSDKQAADHFPELHGPPYDGAHLVAWIRPPELAREYSIVFTCTGMMESTFVLDSSDSGQETKTVPGIPHPGGSEASLEIPAALSASEHKWYWFSLSSAGFWKLSSCEVSLLPV